MTSSTPTAAPAAEPKTFTQRSPQGCTIEGSFHPHTGIWSAWVTKGDASRYVSAATKPELLAATKAAAIEIHAEYKQLQADFQRVQQAERAQLKLLKQYPEIVRKVTGLPKDFTGTVARQPGGQPLWHGVLDGPDGYHWAPGDTYSDQAKAAQAVKDEAKKAHATLLAERRAHAKQEQAIGRALATAIHRADLTTAGDLAWDIVVQEAERQGLALDSRNAPANTCCSAAPKSMRDSSRIINVDKTLKAVLVRSVWWTHHSKSVHTNRTHTVIAWIEDAQVHLVEVNNTCRTVKGAIAALNDDVERPEPTPKPRS